MTPEKSLPKPNYTLHELDYSYFLTLWIMTNVCLVVSGAAGIVFMRRTLKIETFTEIFVCMTKLVKNPEQYKDVAATLLANAPPSISQAGLVYFAMYFAFVAVLWVYMNL
ncbi:peptide ABC transporter permease, putative [Babesia ovata]|uniref:Peptide ABC transporter permease, putative n=1 Tax=Babesia ovata TaxID=189622 RepID=A0A2H6KCU3_9APIC|nr:peptide ABC transporter permease, putative [Babesia ovata]GBE60820.1 peptide ABC transporter permease, putative [Babesia ovata]